MEPFLTILFIHKSLCFKFGESWLILFHHIIGFPPQRLVWEEVLMTLNNACKRGLLGQSSWGKAKALLINRHRRGRPCHSLLLPISEHWGTKCNECMGQQWMHWDSPLMTKRGENQGTKRQITDLAIKPLNFQIKHYISWNWSTFKHIFAYKIIGVFTAQGHLFHFLKLTGSFII